MKPISREAIVERRQTQMRWSAVIAGSVLAIGLWMLLQALGVGLGLSAIDTSDPSSLRAVGIGTGVWSIVAPLIALFLGAMLAGRLAGTSHASVGALHGSVLWALTMILGLWLVISIVSMLAMGAARVGGAAVGATSSAVSGATSGEMMSSLGLDADDLLAPVNERLREQGKPTITQEQLEASLRGVAQRGVREGRLDREMLVQELAKNTSLSREDVQDLANQIGDRYDQVAGQVGEQAQGMALTAADRAGKALLMSGIALLLGLGAALGGGALGARMATRDREQVVGPTREGEEVTTRGERVTTTREGEERTS